MPESSYPFPLNEYMNMISLWVEQSRNSRTTFIIGSHKREGECLYNSAYHIKKSRIIKSYEKNKLTPFTEYLPHHFRDLPTFKKLFSYKEPFSPGRRTLTFLLKKSFVCAPYICSDLFFSIYPSSSCTSLFLVNESWSTMRYMHNLMYYYAVFKSIEWSLDGIYASFTRGMFISKTGFQTPLITV